jgi:hypothetical protein
MDCAERTNQPHDQDHSNHETEVLHLERVETIDGYTHYAYYQAYDPTDHKERSRHVDETGLQGIRSNQFSKPDKKVM